MDHLGVYCPVWLPGATSSPVLHLSHLAFTAQHGDPQTQAQACWCHGQWPSLRWGWHMVRGPRAAEGTLGLPGQSLLVNLSSAALARLSLPCAPGIPGSQPNLKNKKGKPSASTFPGSHVGVHCKPSTRLALSLPEPLQLPGRTTSLWTSLQGAEATPTHPGFLAQCQSSTHTQPPPDLSRFLLLLVVPVKLLLSFSKNSFLNVFIISVIFPIP